jgi:NADPH-dependent ferric siderophore reductase
LLVADETGLPAAAAILSSLPEGARAAAVLEVADESEEQRLVSRGDVDITWLHRGDALSSRRPSLVEAVRALELPELASREAVYVWGAGEGAEISALRHHLRDERGLGAEALSLTPYWRLAG